MVCIRYFVRYFVAYMHTAYYDVFNICMHILYTACHFFFFEYMKLKKCALCNDKLTVLCYAIVTIPHYVVDSVHPAVISVINTLILLF